MVAQHNGLRRWARVVPIPVGWVCDRALFRGMDVLAIDDSKADRLWCQLVVLGLDRQLGAVGDDFWRADLGCFRADHAVIVLAQRCLGQGIGAAASSACIFPRPAAWASAASAR